MTTRQRCIKAHVGPSALGYDVGTIAWWACAIRQNYRSAREALANARYWSVRLTEHLAAPKSRRSERRAKMLLGFLTEALDRAAFWREQARNTRHARSVRIGTLGPLS